MEKYDTNEYTKRPNKVIIFKYGPLVKYQVWIVSYPNPPY